LVQHHQELVDQFIVRAHPTSTTTISNSHQSRLQEAGLYTQQLQVLNQLYQQQNVIVYPKAKSSAASTLMDLYSSTSSASPGSSLLSSSYYGSSEGTLLSGYPSEGSIAFLFFSIVTTTTSIRIRVLSSWK